MLQWLHKYYCRSLLGTHQPAFMTICTIVIILILNLLATKAHQDSDKGQEDYLDLDVEGFDEDSFIQESDFEFVSDDKVAEVMEREREKHPEGTTPKPEMNETLGPQGRGFLGLSLPKLNLESKIAYYLYTRHNRKHGLLLSHGTKTKGFHQLWKKDEPVKFIVHGWSGVGHGGPKALLTIKNKYLKDKRPGNFIFVDWTDYSQNVVYGFAARNTVKVGDMIGTFIADLYTSNHVKNARQFHCIGFSLGGQICGRTGYRFRVETKHLLGRVTGLDPAGPTFSEYEALSERIDKTDARFVDIIHCNTKLLGTEVVSGHADFYPNSGVTQPGCAWDLTGACSHTSCVTIFRESIHSEFWGCPCDSWDLYENDQCCREGDGDVKVLLGEKCPDTARGKYFLYVKVKHQGARDNETVTADNVEPEKQVRIKEQIG